jgi:hypothetical protein
MTKYDVAGRRLLICMLGLTALAFAGLSASDSHARPKQTLPDMCEQHCPPNTATTGAPAVTKHKKPRSKTVGTAPHR